MSKKNGQEPKNKQSKQWKKGYERWLAQYFWYLFILGGLLVVGSWITCLWPHSWRFFVAPIRITLGWYGLISGLLAVDFFLND